MPDAPIPADLIELQRVVYAAQRATRAATDEADRERRREAEREAVLALHRHPAHRDVPWQALRDAALAEDAPPDDAS
ncbi:MAG TPA: hypothetical protein VLH10_01620 [Yinghuangia sp.]|uniref:hypothetical protein n=1 Tax=Yinghuangia sp. YIM S10712 TaxID=3436930 RepID=UPI002C19A8A1|nr:hypothetical protein [Yinghuangia sp.]